MTAWAIVGTQFVCWTVALTFLYVKRRRNKRPIPVGYQRSRNV